MSDAERLLRGVCNVFAAGVAKTEASEADIDETREVERRINAFPDLVAACEKWADIIQGGDRFERMEPWAQECVSDLRAALAQAKGESNV